MVAASNYSSQTSSAAGVRSFILAHPPLRISTKLVISWVVFHALEGKVLFYEVTEGVVLHKGYSYLVFCDVKAILCPSDVERSVAGRR